MWNSMGDISRPARRSVATAARAVACVALLVGPTPGCGDDPLPDSAGAGDSGGGLPTFDVLDDVGVGVGGDGSGSAPSDTSDPPDEGGGPVELNCVDAPFAFLCPCEFNPQCASGYCVQKIDEDTGTSSSVCTTVCDGECPEGWGCQPIVGAGDTVFICIPVVDTLCDPCAVDADCKVVDALCLQVGDGTYCGRDCTDPDLPCPDGYACEQVPRDGGGSARQCVPAGGSCLCPPDVDVLTDPEHCGECGEACDIFGAVPTCVDGECVLDGCAPGYVDLDGEADNGCEYECSFTSDTDVPDTAGFDANCDGVDGDVTRMIFVASDGKANGKGTRDDPVSTVTKGIEKALSAGKDQVAVAAGTYVEQVLVAPGVSLFGGYGPDGTWSRDLDVHKSIVRWETPEGSGAVKTLVVDAVDLPTKVQGLVVESGNNAVAGGSSYAVWIRDTTGAFELDACRLVGGSGGAGASGEGGAAGDNGSVGKPGVTTFDGDCQCNEAETYGGPGGAAGPAVCPGGVGAGGKGGDSNCGEFGNSGQPSPGGAPGGPHEQGGADGDSGDSGAHGSGGSVGLVDADGLWRGDDGDDGGDGQPGVGGGGGGAGDGYGIGGFSLECPIVGGGVHGGGGGGGGSAGCGGLGGKGGGAGGGSFGVLLVGSDPVLRANTFAHRSGGNGGQGGLGGTGGKGKAGGGGGAGHDNASDGGQGGQGGDGGDGGHGGGGLGGVAFGLYLSKGSSPACIGNTYEALGTGGFGGLGGTLDGDKGDNGASGPVNALGSGCP